MPDIVSHSHVSVGLDVGGDCPLGEFLRWCNKYGATIERFVGDGPAGGNPYVILKFRCIEDWEAANNDEWCRAPADDGGAKFEAGTFG